MYLQTVNNISLLLNDYLKDNTCREIDIQHVFHYVCGFLIRSSFMLLPWIHKYNTTLTPISYASTQLMYKSIISVSVSKSTRWQMIIAIVTYNICIQKKYLH